MTKVETYNNQSIIEQMLEQASQSFDAALEQGAANMNHDKMHANAIMMLTLWVRAYTIGHTHMRNQELKDEVKNGTKLVQSTFNKVSKIVATAVSILLTVVVGFCALSPLTGTRLFSNMTTRTLSNNSQALNSMVTSSEGVGGVFEQSAQKERTGYQHRVETARSEHDMLKHQLQQDEARLKDLLRSNQERDNSSAQNKRDVVS